MIVSITGVLVVMGDWVIAAQDKQDKYSLEVPGGLAFSEFKGYEDWPAVGPSYADAQNVIRLIPANPTMIDAYKRGAPANDKPFPDGSKIAKIEWRPKKVSDAPFSASTLDMVHGDLIKVEFIEKDSKRFSDTHGWGYAMFDYDAASSTFTPATVASKPPQRNAAAIAHHEDPGDLPFHGHAHDTRPAGPDHAARSA